MGTPDFAVPCLQAMINSGHDICGVFTRPDKPRGRGHKLMPTPIKSLALEHNIPVYQPKSLRIGEDSNLAYETLQSLAPDIIVVVAYGCILPKRVLELPKFGCVNVHASILPLYRGAAPIQWSILSGEQETGITTMYMAEGLDTGDMILKTAIPIGENETSSELHDRLSALGSTILTQTLDLIKQGKAPRTPQKESEATFAPMITKEQSHIDFTKSAAEIHNLIRAITGYTFYEGMRIKFYRSELTGGNFPNTTPGEIVNAEDFTVVCGDGNTIKITELQAECCRKMSTDDYLCGKAITKGDILGGVQKECTLM